MNFWRQAGLSYLRYLNYSSKVVRAAVRPGVQEEKKITSRDATTLTWRMWTEGKKNAAGTIIFCLNNSSATSILVIAMHGSAPDIGKDAEMLWTINSQFSLYSSLNSPSTLHTARNNTPAIHNSVIIDVLNAE